MMPGSARGLRNSPCITAPQRPRMPPTAMHSRVRGRRISCTISSLCASIPLSLPANKACRLSAKESDMGPVAREPTSSRASVQPVSASSQGSGRRIMNPA